MTVTLGQPADLTPETYNRVIYDGEPVALASDVMARLDRNLAAFNDFARTAGFIYGTTTGAGAMVHNTVDRDAWQERQRKVVLNHSAAIGPPLPGAVARGIILVRLAHFLGMTAAVSPHFAQYLTDRLNDGFTPWVPSEGMGMDGETIPHGHVSQTFIGEGFVMDPTGQRVPAGQWLAAHDIAPVELGRRDGGAFSNGFGASVALAMHVRRRLARALDVHTAVAACSAEAMAVLDEHYGPDVVRLLDARGLPQTIAAMAGLMAGSAIPRAGVQAAISYRVTPQVHAVLLDALWRLDEELAREMRSRPNNVAFFPAGPDGPARVVHAGQFHNQPLANLADAAALALAQVAILANRRLHRLLDPQETGLSKQLALQPGTDSGLIILHKSAVGFEPELKALAQPFSLHTVESSLGHTDVETMAMPALGRLLRMADMTAAIAAYELYAALVAIDQRGARPGAGVAAIHALVRARIPPFTADRNYGPEIETLRDLMATDAFLALIPSLDHAAASADIHA